MLGADFIVSTQAQRPFPAEIATKAAQVPGVLEVSAVAIVPAKVNRSIRSLIAVDPSILGGMLALTFADGSLGGYVVNRASIAGAGIEIGDGAVYVKVDAGADPAQVQQALTAALAGYPTVQVQSQTEFKEQISSSVNQVLLVMLMLLSLAIFIAVLGIVSTLVLSVIERTREIGMLRAIGALRRHIRSTVVLEALIIAVYGAIVGLVLGFLAALWPAFRAGRLNVLQAISTE